MHYFEIDSSFLMCRDFWYKSLSYICYKTEELLHQKVDQVNELVRNFNPKFLVLENSYKTFEEFVCLQEHFGLACG